MRLRVDKRETLVDAVEARLERAILEERFGAGDVLPSEQRLADELGVSKGTLRLATSRLIARGLLEASQGRQTRISRLGRVATLDALVPTVIAAREDPEARKLLADLLEVRRYLYAELLARACERSRGTESLSKALVSVACHARWEKDVRSTMDLELQLLALASREAGNAAFIHVLGSLHRLFEQLPEAWLNGRPLEAIERRMLRCDDLLQAHQFQSLRGFLLESLEAEDEASMAALCAPKRGS